MIILAFVVGLLVGLLVAIIRLSLYMSRTCALVVIKDPDSQYVKQTYIQFNEPPSKLKDGDLLFTKTTVIFEEKE